MTALEPTSAPAPLDLELHQVRRAQSGDAAAFRWLFDRHGASVRRFLHDLLRNADAADEATQETFVRAHRQLGSLRELERCRAWLFAIGRRVSLEHFRRARRMPLALAEAPEAIDRAPSPEALLLGREADRVIDRALETLSDERRASLLLRLDHGMDYDAITTVMGWSLAKVKNEIHRARLVLREHVGDYVEGAR